MGAAHIISIYNVKRTVLYVNTQFEEPPFGGPNMPLHSHARFFNALDKYPPVDIYADGVLIARNLAYGDFTDYISVQPGIYDIVLYPTGETENPIGSTTESFSVGRSFTVVAVDTDDSISIYKIHEPYQPLASGLRSYMRLINLSKSPTPLDAFLQNGAKVFENVGFEELSSYNRFTPNIYTMTVKSSGSDKPLLVVPNLNLTPGKVYSVYIIGDPNGNPPLEARFVSDSEVESQHMSMKQGLDFRRKI